LKKKKKNHALVLTAICGVFWSHGIGKKEKNNHALVLTAICGVFWVHGIGKIKFNV
jgi:uncharacterized membrane protein YphA (DoxX/SURF4 family)